MVGPLSGYGISGSGFFIDGAEAQFNKPWMDQAGRHCLGDNLEHCHFCPPHSTLQLERTKRGTHSEWLEARVKKSGEGGNGTWGKMKR